MPPPSHKLDTAARYVLLPLLSAFGFYSTWTLSRRTGLFTKIEQIRSVGPMNLPGTEAPLKSSYTTVPEIDRFLAILAATFWPAVEGRDPALSLQAMHFAGQVMAAWIVIEIEGRRRGNAWRLAGCTTLLGVLTQSVAFTVVAPLYYAIHLFTSPTALSPPSSRTSPTSPPPSSSLLVLPAYTLPLIPLSLCLSYLLPAIIISLPSPTYTTYDTRQILMAIWQIFPLTTTVLITVLSLPLRLFSSSSPSSYPSSAARNLHTLSYLRPCYVFALSISVFSHIVPLTLSFSSLLLPHLFNPAYLDDLHPYAIFLPPSPTSTVLVKSIAEGFHHFLIYDELVGFTATILWAVVLLRNADAKTRWGCQGWAGFLVGLGVTVVFAGPAAAVVNTIWSRDELVLGGGGDVREENVAERVDEEKETQGE